MLKNDAMTYLYTDIGDFRTGLGNTPGNNGMFIPEFPDLPTSWLFQSLETCLSSQVQSHRQPHGHSDIGHAAVDQCESRGHLGGLGVVGSPRGCVL